MNIKKVKSVFSMSSDELQSMFITIDGIDFSIRCSPLKICIRKMTKCMEKFIRVTFGAVIYECLPYDTLIVM